MPLAPDPGSLAVLGMGALLHQKAANKRPPCVKIFSPADELIFSARHEVADEGVAEKIVSQEILKDAYPQGSYYDLQLRRTVRAHAKAMGEANRIPLPVDEVIRDRESGLSVPKLADKYGVHYHTIRRRLTALGIK